MTRRGRASADDAARDAERQRHRRARACGRTESRSGPARENRRTDRPSPRGAVGSPDGSSQRGSSPMTTALARREQAGLPQLRHHAIEPVRALADLVEEQDVAGRRVEGVRRAERRQQLRQRPAEQRARRPRPGRASRRPAAPARPSARGGRAPVRTSRGRSRRRRGRAGRRASVRETRRGRSRSVRNVSSAVRSL